MVDVTEIAPDVYRLSIYNSQIDLQFNHFLVRDDAPLLFTTGLRSTYEELHDAVARILKPETIRWISYGHFESDECGAMNQWLAAAPNAQPVCNFLQAVLNMQDFSDREPRVLAHDEILSTGRCQFKLCSTAHLPHGWDSSVLFEQTDRTLFCSDLFSHFGQVEPMVETNILDRAQQSLLDMEKSPFAYYVPYTARTRGILHQLADLNPVTLATMHGSSFRGDGGSSLRDLDIVLKETLSENGQPQ